MNKKMVGLTALVIIGVFLVCGCSLPPPRKPLELPLKEDAAIMRQCIIEAEIVLADSMGWSQPLGTVCTTGVAIIAVELYRSRLARLDLNKEG